MFVTITASKALYSKHPRIAAEWHPTKNLPLTPYLVTPGSNRKVWWFCKSGHEWVDTISHRISGRGCHVCNKEKRNNHVI
ncbi:MAG: zinc-ribbon domain-containing protein [Candidatus Delongbacteria bacterium]|nr:zinc-ribbon domain-containing protein [Candidatus Delongbacteria bacterium]